MTDNKLKASAQRVQDFLAAHQAGYLVKELPSSTRTARDAAEAIGCQVAQIAKSLIFRDEDSGHLILIIVSGINRVALLKVQEATGLKIAKATADFVKQRVGNAIGGVPPVAHDDDVVTILDPDLKKYQKIWAAAVPPPCGVRIESPRPRPLDQWTMGSPG